jgi:hypothetical protein
MAGRPARDVLLASAVAGTLSGAPSTAHALATGGGVLTAARAAGELLGRPGLVRGAVAHVGLSVGWAAVLGVVLPSAHQVAWGAAAGLAIAGLDLGLAEHRFPAIAALPRGGQVADHVAYGALVGVVFAARDGGGAVR